MKCISLFSGMGGDSHGIVNSGCELVAYSELEKIFQKTHELNFENCKLLGNGNIIKTNDEEFTEDASSSDENNGHFESNIAKQMNSRTQAIEQLDLVAEFFRKTEPHSPMSYAIEQVVRWSGLSLPELLQELITDGDARNGYFKLSGIKTEE